MKTIKLLAALAVPAMFAACTSEDIVSNNSQMTQKEVVGAELVGTGVSLNVTDGDVQSRIANVNGQLKWTSSDRLGLGWLLTSKNDPTKVQDPDSDPATSNVWANNLFEMEGDKQGVFTTKGNIYVGWQFAYFPFEYQNNPGELKFVTVNPCQETMDIAERYSQNFHVSGRTFIQRGVHLDKETNQLTTSYTLNNVMNTLYMTTNPVANSSFVAGEDLAELEINSVTINAGKEVFTDHLFLKAKELPVQGEANLREEMKNLFKCYKDEEHKVEGRNASTTTTINADYKVSNGAGTNRIMPIVYPTYASVELNPYNVSIVIEAGRGVFTVKYVDEDSDDFNEAAAKNNEVIENLVAAYGEDGSLTKWTGVVSLGEIQLYDDIFEADFTNIRNAEEWNEAVVLANALNVTKVPEFELATDAEVVLSSKLNLPVNGVTVIGAKTSKFIVEKSYTWTESLKSADNIKVVVATEKAKLTLNSGVALKNPVTNAGVITVKKGATLGKGNLVNNKTVYVEFGGFVYPQAGKEGSIVYKVPSKYSLKTIDDMIGTGSNGGGSANVNTLEINNNVDLKCQSTSTTDGEESDNNPYNPTNSTPGSSSTYTLNLAGINLWINGTGKVSATAPYTHKVNDVVMNGGEISGIAIGGNVKVESGEAVVANGDITGNVTINGTATISNSDIAGDVTVESGSATISNGDIEGNVTVHTAATISNGNIAGNVTLTKGESNFANVNIYSILTIAKGATANMSNETNAIKIKEIVNRGTLTSTNDINVENITTENCETYVESAPKAMDKVIWYTNEHNEIGGNILSGRILHVSATAFADALNAVKDNDIIVVNSDLKLSTWNDLNPSNKKYTLDLNGNTLTIQSNKAYGYDTANKNLTIKNGKIVGPMFVQGITVKFENISFETPKSYLDQTANYSSLGIVYLSTNADVTFEKCTFKTDGRHLEIESGMKNLVINQCKFIDLGTIYAPSLYLASGSKAKIIVKDSYFETELGIEFIGNEKNITVTGNTFEKHFGFAERYVDLASLSNNSKNLLNSILANNTFLDASKKIGAGYPIKDYINVPF